MKTEKKMSYLNFWKYGRGLISSLLIVVCSTMSAKQSEVLSHTQAKIEVKGTVTDETNTPMIGVTVLVEGTNTGATTDIDGKYTVIVSSENAVLVYSYLGYETQKQKVGARRVINISFKEDATALNEVVVTALGMERDKKALGYAMTELKGDDLLKSNTVNPINALQGKVAGVQINMGSAGPQSAQRMIIRGNTSLTGKDQPIFVIDGIIIENENSRDADKGSRDFGNQLKNLNSDDFETVSVLKGAAATALYGSRASNGVILITTKKGKRGEGIGISVTHTQQWEKLYKTPKYQNEFGTIGQISDWNYKPNGEQIREVGSPGKSFGAPFDGKPYQAGTGSFTGPYQAYENNARDMYRTGRYENTNVAISGGSEKGAFRVSYSNMTNKGMTFNNKFDRHNIALNASQDISKYLTVDAGFTYVKTDTRNPTYQGGDKSPLYDFSYRVPREYNTKYWMQDKRYINALGDGYNDEDPFGYSSILFDLLENNQLQKEENYRANITMTFKITDWLKLVGNADMNRLYSTMETKVFATEKDSYGGSAYKLHEDKNLQQKMNAMLMGNKTFGDFNLAGTFGVERWDARKSYHNSQTNGGLRVPGKFELNNSNNDPTTSAYSNIHKKRINSIFGMINTSWKNQLYLDLTARNDWSSTLIYADGSGESSYFYPSISTSWLLTETLRSSLPEKISFFKARASYAVVGSDTDPYTITNPGTYKYQGSYKNDYFGGGNVPYYNFINKAIVEKPLRPEKQYAMEFGVDYRMFNNMLGLDLAYYKTNTKNQIITAPMSPESGLTRRTFNAGEVQNQGIELAITAEPIKTKDWFWDMTFTFTKNWSKIKSLHPEVPTYTLIDGLETAIVAAPGSPYGDIVSTAAYKRDENGNKLIDSKGYFIRSGEAVKIGNMQPKFLLGFNSSVTWKDLTLGVILDARVGGDLFSGSYNYGMSSGTLASSLFGRTEKYGGLPRTFEENGIERTVYDGVIPDGVYQPGSKITHDGKEVDVSGMSYREAYEKGYVNPQSAYNYYIGLYEWSGGIREEAIHKVTWVALREISLFWNIPRVWTNKAFVKSASLGFTVRNVAYLYNSLPDNIHPEGWRSNHGAEYIEAGGNVFSRNYGLKLNLTF